MLKHTFQHIEGYSPIKENNLWKSGITTWDMFVEESNRQLCLFDEFQNHSILDASIEALHNKNTDFFAQRLPSSEMYRVALSFPEDTMFLDIETTGLSRYYDHITLIGWSFLNEYDVYYIGLDKKKIISAFDRAKCIVTYNGSIFDIPFIKKEFPEIKIPNCQIDLRFFSKRFGYSGGLKNIESEIGFVRSSDVSDISGEVAPILWHQYMEGNIESLKRLIDYNRFDIDGMKILLDLCIKKKLDSLSPINKIIKPFIFSDYYINLSFSNIDNGVGIYIKNYTGHTGPNLIFEDLPSFKNLSIIGIDLTGSEEKASGWSHLLNQYAITDRINSDDELIEKSLKYYPDLISIDSPLSLPIGRKTVFDDDEGRNEFGIMRVCERILKKRGVNVYPALIPSMQKLTQRGIALADKFRKKGIPVIECYPGAAQDILGIPRKGISLEYLTKGLRSFGITGGYVNNVVSHDELDAITAALLGYFFWSGKFEAIGNEQENYLIIPDIEKSNPAWQDVHVVGFSGRISSGKTTAGKYFEQHGYSYGRFSMVIRDLVEREGKTPKRSNLQEMGDKVNRDKGQRWLCHELIERFFKNQKKIVIDGLRFPEDHAYFKEVFANHFIHIHLESDEEIRRNRYNNNSENDTSFDIANNHSVERSIDNFSDLANVIISNNKNIDYFYAQLKQYII